jgi:hypothetical protein
MLFLNAGKETDDVLINVTLRRACYILCFCCPKYPIYNARAPYFHLWPVCVYHIFPHYLINRKIFGKKNWMNIKYVLFFSTASD